MRVEAFGIAETMAFSARLTSSGVLKTSATSRSTMTIKGPREAFAAKRLSERTSSVCGGYRPPRSLAGSPRSQSGTRPALVTRHTARATAISPQRCATQ